MKLLTSLLLLCLCCACNSTARRPDNTPVSARDDFQKAMRRIEPLIATANYSQAQALLMATQDSLRGTEFFYQSQYWLGECAMGLSQFGAAEHLFQSAYSSSKSAGIRSQALEGLARALYFSHDYTQALKKLTFLHRHYPSQSNGARVLFLMANAAEKSGDLQRAESCRRQLRALYPQSPLLKDSATPSASHALEGARRAQYYLQCGIFSDSKNVNTLVNTLKWNGFTPFTVKKATGKIHVMLGYYSSQQLAEIDRKQLERLGLKSIVKL